MLRLLKLSDLFENFENFRTDLPGFSEIWEMLSTLEVPALLLSVVSFVILDLFVISVIFAVGRESRLCRKRWQKVSAGLELRQKLPEIPPERSGKRNPPRERRYPLEADEILLGRHVSADIRLRDATVLRYHAVMTVTGGVWSITDLDAKGGTYVNNQKIRQKKLSEGDCIRLGNTELYLVKRPDMPEHKI